MKQILDNINAAQYRLNHTINNHQSYWYTVTVEVKHARRVLGIKWKPYYTYHDERRFNQGKYYRDIAAAQRELAVWENQANALINDAEQTLNTVRQKQTTANGEIRVLQNKLNHFKAQHHVYNENYASILQSQSSQLAALNNEIATRQNEISQAPHKIATMQQNIASHSQALNQSKEKLAQAKEECSRELLVLQEHLRTLGDKKLAYIFAENYHDPTKVELINLITEIGFNSGDLGYYAIVKNDLELAKIALAYGVNFGSYCYDGKTLIQHLLRSSNTELIDFILSLENQDFICTILAAMGINDGVIRQTEEAADALTLETLLSRNSYLLGEKYQGYSLLHLAIATKKTDVVELLIGLDATMLDVLTDNLDSAFAIAIRQNELEVINVLLRHIDLEYEIKMLMDREQDDLLATLQELAPELGESAQELIRHIVGDKTELYGAGYAPEDMLALLGDYEIQHEVNYEEQLLGTI